MEDLTLWWEMSGRKVYILYDSVLLWQKGFQDDFRELPSLFQHYILPAKFKTGLVLTMNSHSIQSR